MFAGSQLARSIQMEVVQNGGTGGSLSTSKVGLPWGYGNVRSLQGWGGRILRLRFSKDMYGVCMITSLACPSQLMG